MIRNIVREGRDARADGGAAGKPPTLAAVDRPPVRWLDPPPGPWSIERAHQYCEDFVRAHSESYPVASRFVPPEVRPHLVRLAHDPHSSVMSEEAATGKYDLVVLGAENRAIQHRLFFGYDNERLIRNAPVTLAIVIPNVAYLLKDDPSAMASLQRPHSTPLESPTPRPI